MTSNTDTTATRKARVRAQSVPQMQQQDAFHRLGGAWNALGDADKDTWLTLAKAGNSTGSVTARPALSAFQTFVSVNSAMIASGYAPLAVAPAHGGQAPVLPPLSLQVAFSAQHAPSLHLTGSYDGPLVVYAAAPGLAGQTTFAKGAFKLLGMVQGTDAPGADITALYLSRFRAPGPGSRVTVRVVAVSASGLRSAPVLASAVAPAVSSALSLSGGGARLKAA